MIILYNFGIGLKEYEERGLFNEFPLFTHCPNCQCHAPGNLHRHGFYWRNGVTEKHVVRRIPICRLRCQRCRMTISVLPDFLIPYFQYTLRAVLLRVLEVLEKKIKSEGRQLLRFHLNRYLRQVKWVHSYFVEQGEVCGLSNDKRKEATKYMKRILDFGESSFLRRSQGHLSRYFMAN